MEQKRPLDRSSRQDALVDIARLQGLRELLADAKSGATFQDMAKDTSPPDPIDELGQHQGNGWASFTTCGRCKYAIGGGSSERSPGVAMFCRLLGGFAKAPLSRFNTPCRLHEKSAEELSSEIARIDRQIMQMRLRLARLS